MSLTDQQLKQLSIDALNDKLKQARIECLKPPPTLTLSQWAEQYFILSAEASAEPGKYTTARAPYQKAMLDACSDSDHEEVVFATSAQIGKTTILLALLLYYIHQEPAPILAVQPTKELAGSFSKDRLAPAIRDTKVVTNLVSDVKSRDASNTILAKSFPGGQVTLVGSNSPSSLASRPIRILLADEVDRYPLSAGTEGDPLQLCIKRTATFYNRKIIMVSTPTDRLTSRIWSRFENSDQRKYYIKCTHCDEYFVPVWKEHIKWQKDASGIHLPETALLYCPHCSAGMDDTQRNAAVRNGKWVITKPNSKVAGFHLSALISPWSELPKLVVEFLNCKQDVQRLKTFVNTILGEPWEDQSDNLDDCDFLSRLEQYDVDSLPSGIQLITAGVDTQDDRLEASLYGWGENNEIWHIDHQVFTGNPANPSTWDALSDFLKTKFLRVDGVRLPVASAAIDSGGHFTAEVYAFCRKNAQRRWWAVKGRAGKHSIWPQRATNTKNEGRVFLIGVDSAKEQLMTQLKITKEGPAYVHFSDRCDAEFFNQLTAEKKVLTYKNGFTFYQYKKEASRRNETWDCFVYAYAAKEGLNVSIRMIKKNIDLKKIKKESDKLTDTQTPPDAANTPATQTVGPDTAHTTPAHEETQSKPANPVAKVPIWKQNLAKAAKNKWTSL